MNGYDVVKVDTAIVSAGDMLIQPASALY